MPDKPFVFLETKTMDSSENTSHFYIFISVLSKRGSESFENMSSVLLRKVFFRHMFSGKMRTKNRKCKLYFRRNANKLNPTCKLVFVQVDSASTGSLLLICAVQSHEFREH